MDNSKTDLTLESEACTTTQSSIHPGVFLDESADMLNQSTITSNRITRELKSIQMLQTQIHLRACEAHNLDELESLSGKDRSHLENSHREHSASEDHDISLDMHEMEQAVEDKESILFILEENMKELYTELSNIQLSAV